MFYYSETIESPSLTIHYVNAVPIHDCTLIRELTRSIEFHLKKNSLDITIKAVQWGTKILYQFFFVPFFIKPWPFPFNWNECHHLPFYTLYGRHTRHSTHRLWATVHFTLLCFPFFFIYRKKPHILLNENGEKDKNK